MRGARVAVANAFSMWFEIEKNKESWAAIRIVTVDVIPGPTVGRALVPVLPEG